MFWSFESTNFLGMYLTLLLLLMIIPGNYGVYTLKTKDQVFDKFKKFQTLVERQTGRKLKCIRTDKGVSIEDHLKIIISKRELDSRRCSKDASIEWFG